MIKSRAESINICARIRVGIVGGVLFDGRVKCGALSLNDGDSDFLWSHNLNKSKVYQFKQTGRRDLEIARFDIAVNDGWLLSVKIIERIRKLMRPTEHFTFRKKSFFAARIQHHRPQVFARDVVHHEIIAWPIRKEIRNFWQVRMI